MCQSLHISQSYIFVLFRKKIAIVEKKVIVGGGRGGIFTLFPHSGSLPWTVRDLESNILMVSAGFYFLINPNILYICYVYFFSRHADKSWFYGCPSRLDQHQGFREQYPDGVQQNSIFSSPFTYYICYKLDGCERVA